MPYLSKFPDEQETSNYYIGFPKGVDNIREKALVGDKFLVQGDNVMAAVDGITRRYGSDRVWDQGSGSYVYGAFGYYNKATASRKFIRVSNGKLQYLSGSTWTDIGATAYTNTKTRFVQAGGKVFIYNGTDNLTNYNGSSITAYTDLSSVSGLAITVTGSAGTTAYSYRVSAFNINGETEACTAVATATGNATLSSTNYNKLDWNVVASATGYNIYGRTATGYTEVYITTVYTNTWNDTGAITPTTSKLPQESDTSAGIKAKIGVFTQGRQYVAGVTEGSTYYPTRLYYSGTITYIDCFNSSEFGGGWVEIGANDGGEIVDIKAFDNGVIVFKTNGIKKFYWTSTGLPALSDVTNSYGGISFESSQAIDNDIIFVGQKENKIGVWSLGKQANYTDNQIRTNEISVFIRDGMTDINRAYITNTCSFNYDNKFGFAYTRGSNTENDTGWVLDTQFGGWFHWDGLPMTVAQYTIYDDGNYSKLYGGSNADGYMIELMKSARNDNGVAFRSVVGTKTYVEGAFDIEKIWRDPTLWFKYIYGGTITAEIWVDGTILSGTASLTGEEGHAGVGVDLMGGFLPGSMLNSAIFASTSSADMPKTLSMIKIARGIGFYLIDNNIDSNWIFMGVHLLYSMLIGKPLSSGNRVSVSAV